MDRSLILFLGLVLGSMATDVDIIRKLKSDVICSYPSKPSVFYTRADSINDTIHYVLTSLGIPSLLSARTDLNTNISLKCDKFGNSSITDSIKFTSKPDYVYVVSFNKLYEYNDTEDTANLDKLNNGTEWNVIDLSNVTWSNATIISNLTSHVIQWKIISSYNNLTLNENGSLTFKFQHFGKDGEALHLPHLQYMANLTQMELKLDNLKPKYMNSRYALEMSLITSDYKNMTKNQLVSHRSIDDEHTPGVFELVDWTVHGNHQTAGGFLQWKPVCYIWDPPSIKNSTQMKSYTLVNTTIPTGAFSLTVAYFGTENANVMATNVSFGLTSDKFYRLTNYTSWTLNIGYGKPPTETISLLIILIISIGLGIPVILIIAGGLCACIRKKKQKTAQVTTTYTQIQ